LRKTRQIFHINGFFNNEKKNPLGAMKLRGADGKFSFNKFFLLVAAKPTAQESCTVQHFLPQSCLHPPSGGNAAKSSVNADGNQAASGDVVKEAASAAAKATTNIGRIRKLCTWI